MNRKNLVETASTLPQVEQKYAAEYTAKRDQLIDMMNQLMVARPDLDDMVGSNNIAMMKDNHANHARFMESIFIQQAPEVLVDTILWVFRAYRSRKFSSTYWAAQMNTWIELYRKELSPECFKQIYPYYNWMQINIPHFNSLAEENLEPGHSAHS